MKDFSGQHAAHIQALYNHVWGAAPNPAAEYDRYVRDRDAIADREEALREDRKDRTREKFRNAGPGPCVELAMQHSVEALAEVDHAATTSSAWRRSVLRRDVGYQVDLPVHLRRGL